MMFGVQFGLDPKWAQAQLGPRPEARCHGTVPQGFGVQSPDAAMGPVDQQVEFISALVGCMGGGYWFIRHRAHAGLRPVEPRPLDYVPNFNMLDPGRYMPAIVNPISAKVRFWPGCGLAAPRISLAMM